MICEQKIEKKQLMLGILYDKRWLNNFLLIRLSKVLRYCFRAIIFIKLTVELKFPKHHNSSILSISSIQKVHSEKLLDKRKESYYPLKVNIFCAFNQFLEIDVPPLDMNT